MRRLTIENLVDFCLRRKLEILCLLLLTPVIFAQQIKEPQERLIDLTGKVHTIAELRGSPAVVNFWATWCGPCKDEMPRLQKLSQSYADRAVKFVAISIDEGASREKIPLVLQKRDFHLPVWQGASVGTLRDLGLGELVPATVVLDAQGNIIGRIEGEAREKDIASRLDWLLNGRQGKAPKPVQKNDW